MKKEQLKQHLSNPHARAFLDLLAKAEGVKHGYNTLFGNTRFDSLADHPNIKKQFTQTDGKKNVSSAAGRYQFLYNTWKGLANDLKLDDFGELNQDIAALELIDRKGALQDVLSGDYRSASQKLGGIWASLPSSNYPQNKRSWEWLDANYDFKPVESPAGFPFPGEVEPRKGTLLADVLTTLMEPRTQPPLLPPEPNAFLGQELINAVIDADAEAARNMAVADFTGKPLQHSIAMPDPIEQSIRKLLVDL